MLRVAGVGQCLNKIRGHAFIFLSETWFTEEKHESCFLGKQSFVVHARKPTGRGRPSAVDAQVFTIIGAYYQPTTEYDDLVSDLTSILQKMKDPQKVSTIVILNIGQFMIGFGLGFSAIFLPHIETQGIKESSSLNQASSPDIGSNEISWIASMLSVGQIFGSLSVSIGGNVLGRKGVMLLSCLPIFLGWLTLFAAQSLALVLVGRLLTGLGMGMQGAIHAVYVSELVNPKWIGTATASGVTTITWGILVAFILGSLIHWRTLCIVFASFPVVMAILMTIVPESPTFLITQRRLDKARSALSWLGRSTVTVSLPNVETLDQDLPCGTRLRVWIKIYWHREVLKPFLVVNGIFTLANFSGFIVVIFYGVTIFQEASPSVNSYIATITIGLVQVFGSLLGVVLIRKLGNRFLLLCSSLGSFISMAALGLTLYVGKQHPEFEFLEWLPVLWLVAFTISFTSGLAPVPWVLMGKLFADHTRSVCAGFTASLFFVTLFIATWTFPHLKDLPFLGISGTFVFCGCFSGLAVIFTLLFVPTDPASDGVCTKVEQYRQTDLKDESAGPQSNLNPPLTVVSTPESYFENPAFDGNLEPTISPTTTELLFHSPLHMIEPIQRYFQNPNI
ncbi:facilitated trehalose transporter Tret1-2 homolog [Tigriopus californicus]|uniref:facilitated trehalose transporter Tret1-2 homolog n=1 Tax=Tigriopus californicus TaxID=6832 RepID=UPI0027DA3DB2|nr:facilitated trehalose transporter Tret1-2 homolog [Tigriopus californicus]